MESINTKFVEGADLQFQIQRTQDVEPIIELAKHLHNTGQHGSSDMKHAAEIPMVLVEAYLTQNGITFHEFANNQDHVKRLLADPAIEHFRVWKGRI